MSLVVVHCCIHILINLSIGAKCGSIFINLAFKQWLRDLIGPQNYNILDQTEMAHNITSHDSEGERMRELMKRFDIKKRAFRRNHRDMKLDLPEPYNNLNLDTRVVGGQITITWLVTHSTYTFTIAHGAKCRHGIILRTPCRHHCEIDRRSGAAG